jgi:4-amino-4-deoxy-L-arabinose transferase-like glycosyltransferase
LPSILAAVALAIILFRAAQCAYGSTAALIAIGALGFNLLSPRLASLVRTDMPLALVIFLIGLLIWRKIRAQTKWQWREQVYMFVLLTTAMLIKGPIVYAFLLSGIALFQWRHGTARPPGMLPESSRKERLDTAWGLQIWPGWWPWIASLAIFLIWVIGGILFQPGFYQEVVMREFVGRFGETIHRPQPLLFYFPHLLHKFAPWSVLMIAIAIVHLRSRDWRFRSVFREMSPETFWLLCWSIGGLIVMSLIPSKRVDRIYPVIPPLCLLLAAQIAARSSCGHGSVSRALTNFELEQTAHPPSPRYGEAGRTVATEGATRFVYRWVGAALVFAVLFTGGYMVAKVVIGYRDHRDALAVFGRKFRHEAEAHHWRYEVVSAKDEGLLLYLRRTHFIQPAVAIVEWNRGNLDALVASAEKAPGLVRQLRDASLSQLKSNDKTSQQGTSYILITR